VIKLSNRYLYGLDISLKNTGITVYDLDTKEFVFISSFSTEKIRTNKDNKHLHLNAIKLNRLHQWMEGIIEEYPPSVVSIERMFSRFPTETQVIAKATGVIQSLLWDKPQYLYPPKKVKALVLNGNATKKELSFSINEKYNDITFENEDESDSFAVALSFLIDNGLVEWEKPDYKEIKTKLKIKNKK